MSPWHSKPRLLRATSRNIAAGLACVSLTTWILLSNHTSVTWYLGLSSGDAGDHITQEGTALSMTPWCPSGGHDVLVSIKTGTTETYKLQKLFETIYQCVPNFLIFSDLEETVFGHSINNALEDLDLTDEELVSSHDELKFYKTMREYRQRGEPLDELLAKSIGDGSKESNLPWILDKWKFLPMLQKSFDAYKASWYVFVEADTYLAWPYLLQWLSRLDSSKFMYLGNRNVFGERSFAHGGSGFILSRQAMELVSELLSNKSQEALIKMTADLCCGDLLVGEVIRELGFDCVDTWPSTPGDNPETIDYIEEKWCYPPAFHHHMNSQQVEQLWSFEQRHDRITDRPLVHADLYKAFVEPNLTERVADWNNMCDDKIITMVPEDRVPQAQEDAEGLAAQLERECLLACLEDPECLRYTWISETTECRLGHAFRFGEKKIGYVSGFVLDRVRTFIDALGTCDEVQWVEIPP